MFDDRRPLTPAVDAIPPVVSWLNGLPGAAKFRRWMLPLYPLAVEHLSDRLATLHAEHPIDLVISTSSAAIKGLRSPRGVPHVCMCFAPARYLWSREEEYAQGSVLRRWGLRLLGPHLREWDRRTSDNVSQFIAISRHVEREIARCYGRDSELVFPPVREAYFTVDPAVPREDFWLVVSALEPYKRTHVAMEAARRANARLIVAGGGSQLEALRGAATRGQQVLGRVSDETLRSLYRRARMLIFPQVEDFGIVALEAQACGCPVVARGEGGALDTVLDGKTGVLCTPEEDPAREVEALIAGAARCPHDASACRSHAEKFGEEAFRTRLLEVLGRVTPSLA